MSDVEPDDTDDDLRINTNLPFEEVLSRVLGADDDGDDE